MVVQVVHVATGEHEANRPRGGLGRGFNCALEARRCGHVVQALPCSLALRLCGIVAVGFHRRASCLAAEPELHCATERAGRIRCVDRHLQREVCVVGGARVVSEWTHLCGGERRNSVNTRNHLETTWSHTRTLLTA